MSGCVIPNKLRHVILETINATQINHDLWTVNINLLGIKSYE